MVEEIREWVSQLPTTLSEAYVDLSGEHLDLSERLSQAVFHTFHSARLWFFLIVDLLKFLGYHAARALIFLFNLVQPFVVRGAAGFRELDTFTQLSVGGAVGLVVVLWLTKRWIVRRRFVPRYLRWYREQRRRIGERLLSLQQRVGEHSRILAAMLPHIALALASGALMYLVPEYLEIIVDSWPFYLMAMAYPITSSTRAIRDENEMKVGFWLEYCIVAYFAVLVGMLPFSQTVVSLVPMFHEMRFFFVVWLLFPLTTGSHLTFRQVLWVLRACSIPGFHNLPVPPSPAPPDMRERARARRPRVDGAREPAGLMGRVHDALNSAWAFAQRLGQIGPMLVESLVIQGFITREAANRLIALRSDNALQLILFGFTLFLPFNWMGYALLAIVFPMRQSILMLADEDMPRVKFWLQYWTILAFLGPLYNYLLHYFWFIPFKGYITLILIVALQFTDIPVEPAHRCLTWVLTTIEGILRFEFVSKRPAEGGNRHVPAQPVNQVELPPPGPEDFALGEHDNLPASPAVQPMSRQSSMRRRRRERDRRRRQKLKAPVQVEELQGAVPAPAADAPEEKVSRSRSGEAEDRSASSNSLSGADAAAADDREGIADEKQSDVSGAGGAPVVEDHVGAPIDGAPRGEGKGGEPGEVKKQRKRKHSSPGEKNSNEGGENGEVNPEELGGGSSSGYETDTDDDFSPSPPAASAASAVPGNEGEAGDGEGPRLRRSERLRRKEEDESQEGP